MFPKKRRLQGRTLQELTCLLDDGAGGALVDACAALAAFGCIDNCDVVAGDCGLRANIDACSACDTLGFFD